MHLWIGATTATLSVAAIGILVRHRVQRTRLYRELATVRRQLVEGHPSALRSDGDFQVLADVFSRDRIATVPNVLTPHGFAGIRDEALANRICLERSFIPLHKQGGTLSYENIHGHAPECLSLYHSHALRECISLIVGEEVSTTADPDQSSCSVLYYTDEGDHIDWHYDHNFYRGRHFTVLICLVNESLPGGPSHSALVYRDLLGRERTVPVPPNTLVVFEGALIRHKVTPLAAGELRVVLSMTLCTDPRIARGRELLRRVKDTAFYGLRALWD